MENALIRITTIAVLATAIPAFAVPQNARAANNGNHNNTYAEETAVPSAVDHENSDPDSGLNAEKDGIDDLRQQIQELSQEIGELRDDAQKSRKKMQQQIEQQKRESMPRSWSWQR